MSDLFHEAIPDEFVHQVFDVMARADWHTFQILTKRHERLAELAPTLRWPANVWMGVSIRPLCAAGARSGASSAGPRGLQQSGVFPAPG